jgi:general secretion pathway protein M
MVTGGGSPSQRRGPGPFWAQRSPGLCSTQWRSERQPALAEIQVAHQRVAKFSEALKAAPAAALARWLAQVRSNTHAVPAEMKLARTAQGASATADSVRWDGSLALDLPADPSRAP